MSSFLYKKSGMESLSIPESVYPDMLKKKQAEKESRELEPLREKMLLELEREQLLRDL